MIVARLEDFAKYLPIQAGLKSGFEFLQRSDLAQLADGRYEIEGDRVLAIVARGFGRGQTDSPLEFHRKYLDIQYVVGGVDLIGWLPTAECRHTKSEYEVDSDLGFFLDRPASWCRIPPGNFAIFFPEDAHAPLGGSGPIHKVVVKVAVSSQTAE